MAWRSCWRWLASFWDSKGVSHSGRSCKGQFGKGLLKTIVIAFSGEVRMEHFEEPVCTVGHICCI